MHSSAKKLIILILFFVACTHPPNKISLNQRLLKKSSIVKVHANGGIYGTGFVVNQNYIVTAGHVVSGSRTVEIAFSTKIKRTGTIAIINRDIDFAVIFVKNMPKSAHSLKLMCSDVNKMYYYHTMGYPGGKYTKKVFGTLDYLANKDYITYILSRTTKGGASGSPLIFYGTEKVYGILVRSDGGANEAIFISTKYLKDLPFRDLCYEN